MMNDSEYALLLKKRFGWELIDPPISQIYNFERVDPFYLHKWLEDNWKLSYYAAVIYLLTIFGLQSYMKKRPAFGLKGPLFVWNLGLGIFSMVGFARTLPEFLYVLSQEDGVYKSICLKKGGSITTAYWGLSFALSKFVELGDTVFIVLRKRPLVLLQWYHHLATLMVVWTVAPLLEPIGRWYGVLNFGVHSFMYSYFAFKTIGIRIPSRVGKFITTLQLTQMIVGFSVNMASLHWLKNGYECVRYPLSIKAFNLVYGSFIFLFGKLFYESVVEGGQKWRKKIR